MITSTKLRDAAIRYQIYLERLKVQTTIDFNKVYLEIEKKMRALLSGLDVAKLDEITRVEIESVIKELRKASVEYTGGALDQLTNDMAAFATYAGEFEAGLLSSAMVKKTAKAMKAKKLMDLTLAQPVPLGDGTATLLGSMYGRLTENTAKRLGDAIRHSWLQGETVQQANKKVFGSKAAGFKDGIPLANSENCY